MKFLSLKKIFQWIPNKIISAQLIFDTTRDGDTIAAFKNKCDGQSPTLVIIKTTKNIIFGGYASSKWEEEKAISDKNAFVFSLNPLKKYNQINPPNAALYYSFSSNIMFQFGCCHFRITSDCTKSNNNCIWEGFYQKGIVDLFKDGDKFIVDRIEIFKLNF